MKCWLKYGLIAVVIYIVLAGLSLSLAYGSRTDELIMIFPWIIMMMPSLIIFQSIGPIYSGIGSFIPVLIMQLLIYFAIGAIIGLITSKIKKDGQ